MKRAIRFVTLVFLLLITACSGEPEMVEVPEAKVTVEVQSDLSDLFYRYEEVVVMVEAQEVTPAVGATPMEIGDPERGREIFENGTETITEECADCHSLDGSEGDGPALQGISERAGDRVPELSSVEYLRQSILDPSAYIVEGFDNPLNTKMPTIYSLFSEEEVDDLVAFLLTQ